MKTIVTFTFGLMIALTGPAFAADAAAPKAKAPAPAPASPTPAPAAAAPAAAAPAASPAAAIKPIDWKGMNKKQRTAYMKKTVVPTMQKVFAEFDAKKYKKITCTTCHGDDGADKAYKMPNPHLPALPTNSAGFKALGDKKPDAMKFMGTKVKPTMAQLLGQPELTPDNPTGFGCYNCHTKEAAPAAPAK